MSKPVYMVISYYNMHQAAYFDNLEDALRCSSLVDSRNCGGSTGVLEVVAEHEWAPEGSKRVPAQIAKYIQYCRSARRSALYAKKEAENE